MAAASRFVLTFAVMSYGIAMRAPKFSGKAMEEQTITSTMTPASVDPDDLVDITVKFETDQNMLTLGVISYSCCCQLDSNKTDVTCELVDVMSIPVRGFKKGCGALKGPGFHSWHNMEALSKYKDLEHAGKCVVPRKELKEKMEAVTTSMDEEDEEETQSTTTTTMDPEALVDLTDEFNADKKSFALGDTTYYCCCQMDVNKTDVTCELVDVASKSVKKLQRKGCGALKGVGFHSWYNMKTIRKYKDLEHAGKCVVPWKKLEAASVSTAVDETTTSTTMAKTTSQEEETTTMALQVEELGEAIPNDFEANA